MLFIRLENSAPIEVRQDFPDEVRGHPELWAMGQDGKQKPDGWINRNDILTFAYASTLASILSERLGRLYLPADAGPCTSPRYDVIEAPQVGDEVSRGFNGDYYPCGTITKITPTYQITTSTGVKFRRVKESSSWRETGRGFWLMPGVRDERNPSF
jgi:hypothetical protein